MWCNFADSIFKCCCKCYLGFMNSAPCRTICSTKRLGIALLTFVLVRCADERHPTQHLFTPVKLPMYTGSFVINDNHQFCAIVLFGVTWCCTKWQN